MAGFVKIHRQITESKIYDMPPLYLRVFERLILEANHQAGYIPFKYPGDKITTQKLIKRGERQTSIRTICEWVGWYEHGVRRTPNAKTIKEILDWLEANDMLEIYPRKSNREGTHYKVVNYGTYQDKNEEKVTVTGAISNSKETVTGSKQECTRMYKKKDHRPKVFSDDSIEMKMCQYMIKKLRDSYPGAIIPPNLNKWCLSFDRLMRLDGRTVDDIRQVMKWVYQDEFWCTNIRSPEKLREKWDTVYLQMQREVQRRRQTENEKQEPAAPYHRKIGGA